MFLSSADNTDELLRIVTGVGCTRNAEIIEQLLFMTTFNENLPFPVPIPEVTADQRAHIFISVVSGSREGTKAGMKFMIDNYSAMQLLFNENNIIRCIQAFGPNIVNEELQKLMIGVQDEVLASITSARVRQVTQDTINLGNSNMEWVKAYGPKIEKWLQDNIAVDDDDGGANMATLNITVMIILLICSSIRYLY